MTRDTNIDRVTCLLVSPSVPWCPLVSPGVRVRLELVTSLTYWPGLPCPSYADMTPSHPGGTPHSSDLDHLSLGHFLQHHNTFPADIEHPDSVELKMSRRLSTTSAAEFMSHQSCLDYFISRCSLVGISTPQWTNQRPVFRSCDHHGPIISQATQDPHQSLLSVFLSKSSLS